MILWGGRFNKDIDNKFKFFNNSIKVDYRLVKQDIFGSISWARALITTNVINKIEYERIKDALYSLLKEVKKNPNLPLDSNVEDIHSWVEQSLINKIGSLGKKLHTGRSRNDQVTTDLKLWCKTKIYHLINILLKLQKMLILTANKHKHTVMPGYTHLQRAQPITFAHWCLAYYEMLFRDKHRLLDTLDRLNINPLGSGALSGTAYSINREDLTKWLGFNNSTKNSLDGVSDRDYILELLSNASISMMHLSRFAEDLIFFNTSEANFIELSDNITSGSSLMPQKKNPDALEIIRSKSGRVYGALIGMMTVLKGLPLSYNKDMQEDKEFIFDALDTWINCLDIAVLILNNIKLNKKNCYKAAQNSYSNATELADYLVLKNIPFREAHYIVGKIVLKAIDKNIPLESMSLEDLQSFSSVIQSDVYSILSIKSCLEKRNVKGGVSLEQTQIAIHEALKNTI